MKSARRALRQLQEFGVAGRAERLLDHERLPAGSEGGLRVALMLTDAALYASTGDHWRRLPLGQVASVRADTDASGVLTRYVVTDQAGWCWLDLTVPMARRSLPDQLPSVSSLPAQPAVPQSGSTWSGARPAPARTALEVSGLHQREFAVRAGKASAAALASAVSLAAARRTEAVRAIRIA